MKQFKSQLLFLILTRPHHLYPKLSISCNINDRKKKLTEFFEYIDCVEKYLEMLSNILKGKMVAIIYLKAFF